MDVQWMAWQIADFIRVERLMVNGFLSSKTGLCQWQIKMEERKDCICSNYAILFVGHAAAAA